MRGFFLPEEAELEIDTLVRGSSDLGLDEAAKSIARTAALGGDDYQSVYDDVLARLKARREKLNQTVGK